MNHYTYKGLRNKQGGWILLHGIKVAQFAYADSASSWCDAMNKRCSNLSKLEVFLLQAQPPTHAAVAPKDVVSEFNRRFGEDYRHGSGHYIAGAIKNIRQKMDMSVSVPKNAVY